MRKIFIVLSLGLIGCGQTSDWVKQTYPDIKRPTTEIDPELIEYINSFKEDAEKYEVTLVDEDRLVKVIFGDPSELTDDSSVIGVCSVYEAKATDKMGVTKKTDYWKDIVVIQPKEFNIFFKLLMYHELGHCLLNRPHTDVEEDLMYPILNGKQALDPDTTIENFFKENIYE